MNILTRRFLPVCLPVLPRALPAAREGRPETIDPDELYNLFDGTNYHDVRRELTERLLRWSMKTENICQPQVEGK